MIDRRILRRKWRRAVMALFATIFFTPSSFSYSPPALFRGRIQASRYDFSLKTHNIEENDDLSTLQNGRRAMTLSRRQALVSVAAAAASLVPTTLANPATAAEPDLPTRSLEDLSLGEGEWLQASSTIVDTKNMIVPATFATYASRLLIQYDEGVSCWWNEKVHANSLLSEDARRSKLGRTFGCWSMSVQLAMNQFVHQKGTSSTKQQYEKLAKIFLEKYGNTQEGQRQIGILFATLPASDQPTSILERLATTTIIDKTALASSPPSSPPRLLTDDLSALLPPNYTCAQIKGTTSFTIYPLVSQFEVGLDEEFGQTATATAFGPLSSTPLKRDKPEYTPDIYALFGFCGAAGCALTHSLVIPLDVVKTRAQTDPNLMTNGMLQGATSIVDKEGINSLFLGAQATIAGYFWYGLSVYPSYTFFKRFVGLTLLPPQVAMVHANDVALVAGAMAAVIASLGLTPLEACRIRTVAEPDIYRPMGLIGTASTISMEDPSLGWKTLYAGFPSLLTRQVIFGSIKFLAFEQACEAIFQTVACAPGCYMDNSCGESCCWRYFGYLVEHSQSACRFRLDLCGTE